MPAQPIKDAADTPLPGALVVWQGMAAALGGALLASVLGVAKLEERSQADAKTIAEMQGSVKALVEQVQALSIEVARQGERIGQLRASNEMRGQGLR